MKTAIKQERPYWCYPTVASMATGLPVSEIIDAIGHDGSRIADASKDEPWCRAAFEFSEMALGMLKLGWAVVPLVAAFKDRPNNEYPSWDELPDIIADMGYPACVTIQQPNGFYHALFWDTKAGIVIDPLTGEEMENVHPVANVELFIKLQKRYRHD